jgi:hypothetical protein
MILSRRTSPTVSRTPDEIVGRHHAHTDQRRRPTSGDDRPAATTDQRRRPTSGDDTEPTPARQRDLDTARPPRA